MAVRDVGILVVPRVKQVSLAKAPAAHAVQIIVQAGVTRDVLQLVQKYVEAGVTRDAIILVMETAKGDVPQVVVANAKVLRGNVLMVVQTTPAQEVIVNDY